MRTLRSSNAKHPMGCKWIFNVKYKADGRVNQYKARLVAKGLTQTYGIDYEKTFAPIAKLNTFLSVVIFRSQSRSASSLIGCQECLP